MSDMEEFEAYLETIAGRDDVTHLEVVRAAAERGWGPLGACWCLQRHFKIPLGKAKGLTHIICNEHGLKEVSDKVRQVEKENGGL